MNYFGSLPANAWNYLTNAVESLEPYSVKGRIVRYTPVLNDILETVQLLHLNNQMSVAPQPQQKYLLEKKITLLTDVLQEVVIESCLYGVVVPAYAPIYIDMVWLAYAATKFGINWILVKKAIETHKTHYGSNALRV